MRPTLGFVGGILLLGLTYWLYLQKVSMSEEGLLGPSADENFTYILAILVAGGVALIVLGARAYYRQRCERLSRAR